MHISTIDALLFQAQKKGILSIGKIDDKGHIIMFTSTKCKVI